MDKLTRHFLEGMVQGRAVKVADDIEKGDNPVSKKVPLKSFRKF